jgi:hypothetical protein
MAETYEIGDIVIRTHHRAGMSPDPRHQDIYEKGLIGCIKSTIEDGYYDIEIRGSERMAHWSPRFFTRLIEFICSCGSEYYDPEDYLCEKCR